MKTTENFDNIKNLNNDISESVVLELEALNVKYKTSLVKYKQAVADYMDNLNAESKKACAKYKPTDKNIDKACYDEIWRKSGCTTTGISATSEWAKNQTLNGLISDTFAWATMTDDVHRKGCYGTSNTNYSSSSAPNFNINGPELTSIKGQAFYGTGPIGNSTTGKTLQDCITSCASTAGCSGATYNSNKVCNLRTGDGLAVPSAINDYAILPKSKQLLLIVESLNKELTSINTQIQTKIDKVYGIYGDQIQERSLQDYDLKVEHEKLKKERDNIQKLIDETIKLESIQNESDLFIMKNYYIFFTLLAIIIGSIIFLGITSLDENTSNNLNLSVVQPVGSVVQTIIQSINPFYLMFGIIILVVCVYIYNRYSQMVYNNTPSLKKMGQMGVLYFVFAFVLIYIGIGYFSRTYY